MAKGFRTRRTHVPPTSAEAKNRATTFAFFCFVCAILSGFLFFLSIFRKMGGKMVVWGSTDLFSAGRACGVNAF